MPYDDNQTKVQKRTDEDWIPREDDEHPNASSSSIP